MEQSLSLRIASIFIILTVSVIGIVLPLHFLHLIELENLQTNPWIRMLKIFSAGIMTGVALIHLLPDAAFSLNDQVPEYPPLAFSIATGGVCLMLFLESFLTHTKSSGASDGKSDVLPVSVQRGATENNCPASITPSHIKPAQAFDGDQQAVVLAKVSDPCNHDHAVNVMLYSTGLLALVKAYLFEASVAVHSVIIGIGLGTLGESDLSTIQALTAAITFHQFFEAIALGMSLTSVKEQLGFAKILGCEILFALSVPVGIFIGIMIQQYGTEDNETVAAVFNALAAGVLLYIAMLELLGKELLLSQTITINPGYDKITMVCSFTLGALVMAIIAIWA